MSITSNAEEQLPDQHEIEEETLQYLFVLEKEFRAFYAEMRKELILQQQWTQRMHIITQRYITIIDSARCCDHPDVYVNPTQICLLQEMIDIIRKLKQSNDHLFRSVHGLRKHCYHFEELCDQLDMNVKSPFIEGDAFHKPIAFFIELVSDLFKYFHAWILKLKYLAHLLQPNVAESVRKYKDAVEFSEDFDEYFDVSLTYCKCLKPQRKCSRK